MLDSPAVQIVLLFGVIIASGLLLTGLNDFIVNSAQRRSSSARWARALKEGQRSGVARSRTMPARSYATVTAVRVPALPKAVAADNRDFKVITVRMRNGASTETELSQAA